MRTKIATDRSKRRGRLSNTRPNPASPGESGTCRIRHVMIPGIIAEDDDRPIVMKPKLDVLDFWSIIKPELPGFRGLCTQVTAFMDEASLRDRLTDPWDAGLRGGSGSRICAMPAWRAWCSSASRAR